MLLGRPYCDNSIPGIVQLKCGTLISGLHRFAHDLHALKPALLLIHSRMTLNGILLELYISSNTTVAYIIVSVFTAKVCRLRAYNKAHIMSFYSWHFQYETNPALRPAWPLFSEHCFVFYCVFFKPKTRTRS